MRDNSLPSMIDSHAHLDYSQLSGDLEGVLARAAGAGVSQIITIGVKLTTSDRPKALAEAHESVWCSVGIHPHEAANEPDAANIDAILASADHPKYIKLQLLLTRK